MGVLVDAQLRISEHLGCGFCLLSVCMLFTVRLPYWAVQGPVLASSLAALN